LPDKEKDINSIIVDCCFIRVETMKCEDCKAPATVKWEIDGRIHRYCFPCYKRNSKEYYDDKIKII